MILDFICGKCNVFSYLNEHNMIIVKNDHNKRKVEYNMSDTKDCNGTKLIEGDNVTLARDLNVKGSSLNIKRGTPVKNIHLTHKDNEVECRIGKSTIVLKTEFLKKA